MSVIRVNGIDLYYLKKILKQSPQVLLKNHQHQFINLSCLEVFLNILNPTYQPGFFGKNFTYRSDSMATYLVPISQDAADDAVLSRLLADEY